jgi:serine/threonine-protein kinase
VPERFEQLVLRCLEKDRERRFSDVAALGRDLKEFGGANSTIAAARVERIIDRAQVARSSRRLPASPTSSSWQTDHEHEGAPERIPGLPRRGYGLAVAALVVLVVGLGAYGYRQLSEGGLGTSPNAAALPPPLPADPVVDASTTGLPAQTDPAPVEPPPVAGPSSAKPHVKKPVARRVDVPDPKKVEMTSPPSPPPSSMYPEIKPIPTMAPPPE